MKRNWLILIAACVTAPVLAQDPAATAAPANPPGLAITALPPTLLRGAAYLRGELADGGQKAAVTLAWGSKVGGDTPASWENKVEAGELATGRLKVKLELPASSPFSYRWFARNAGGEAKSEPVSFTTAAPLKPGDVTFFSTSDTHFTFDEKKNPASRYHGIDAINYLAGKEYPVELGGGTVDVPRGVLVLGDLIDNGDVASKAPQQFEAWLAAFGLTGDKLVAYPVYEGFGNHDLSKTKFVHEAIKERNKTRVGVTNISTNGYHYSWDWDQVHLVQLNLFPGETRASPRYGPIHDAEWSLAFLKDDLEKKVGKSGRPVVLMHHYDVHDDWWTEEQRDKYYEVIKDYNVVAIVYGHTGTGIGKWRGIDFVNDGNLTARIFVFNLTPDHMRVVSWDHNKKEWSKSWRLNKTIESGDWKPK